MSEFTDRLIDGPGGPPRKQRRRPRVWKKRHIFKLQLPLVTSEPLPFALVYESRLERRARRNRIARCLALILAPVLMTVGFVLGFEWLRAYLTLQVAAESLMAGVAGAAGLVIVGGLCVRIWRAIRRRP